MGSVPISILLFCSTMLLPMEMINTNCVQCLYHWHRPLELMIQVISGVYCSAERVASLYTNMEVSNLHVGGMGKRTAKEVL
jgi:hypothetical protein